MDERRPEIGKQEKVMEQLASEGMLHASEMKCETVAVARKGYR